jgi:enoyl-[acyl-carrier protein] reductase II
MKTAITELFGIEHPVLNAGMGRIAYAEMVIAVCNAGGLGVYGAGTNPPDRVREDIRLIRSKTDRPFGINAPLALPNALENIKVALEEEVPVINYSMGRGDWIVKRAHAYGGKVMASVNSVKLAQSAQKHGADAVIAAGHEAAGHAGDIPTFVLVPRLRELLDIPIIAAGGVATGSGLVGALALGADGVSMGTRMLLTREGVVHDNFKQRAIESDVDRTLFSDKFDGHMCRVLNTPGPERIYKGKQSLNPLAAFAQSFAIARELEQPYLKMFADVMKKGPKQTFAMMRMARMLKMGNLARFEGDLERGQCGAGMSVGLVHDCPSIAEVIERVVVEAEEAFERLAGKMDYDISRRTGGLAGVTAPVHVDA